MSLACQRWRDRRHHFRPAGETINTAAYEVAALEGDTLARAFIERHHYSGSYPAARFRFGLFARGGELAGVAVFSVPMRASVITDVFPGDWLAGVELGRFVLLDGVPANGETWFLGQAFAALRREGLRGVVSFSDPVPRQDIGGRAIFPGHIGTIYQAHNARYLGRATARTLRLLPDGKVLSARAIQKVRAGERGAAAVIAKLEAAGAPPLERGGHRREWLRGALETVTRPLRHAGNYRYAWPLDRRQLVAMPSFPYPKARLESPSTQEAM